jgi:hypothetical protein
VKGRQLSLFDIPAPPSRPFERYSRKFDEVRICSHCGRHIVVRHTRDALIAEFLANGFCWKCHRASASRRFRSLNQPVDNCR